MLNRVHWSHVFIRFRLKFLMDNLLVYKVCRFATCSGRTGEDSIANDEANSSSSLLLLPEIDIRHLLKYDRVISSDVIKIPTTINVQIIFSLLHNVTFQV